MKISKKHIIAFTLLAFIGIVNDITLSINAYIRNPEFFIEHEAHREFADFLSTGAFPTFIIIGIIGLFILSYIAFCIIDELEPGWKNYTFLLFALAMVFLFTLRTTGGLTWYLYPHNLEPLIRLLQVCSYVCLVSSSIICLHFIIKKEKEKKNAIPNPTD